MLTRCTRSSSSAIISTPPIIIVTPAPATATMAVQDDLATLFAKNLTLTQHHQHQQHQQQPPTPPEDPTRIVYASQHYTHSAHVHVHQHQPVQRPSSEPDLADLEHALRARGVDAAALSPPQVELFRRADDAQRARLVELWTICPPPLPHPSSSLTWSPTSLEHEEVLARRRWDETQQQQQMQLQQQQQHADDVAMSVDGAATADDDVETASSSAGSPSSARSPDVPWAPSVVAHAHTYMEPYMQSGYEQLARREYDATCGGGAGAADGRKGALDPVYKATGMLDWERQQWMENQYGSFVGGWRDDEDML